MHIDSHHKDETSYDQHCIMIRAIETQVVYRSLQNWTMENDNATGVHELGIMNMICRYCINDLGTYVWSRKTYNSRFGVLVKLTTRSLDLYRFL